MIGLFFVAALAVIGPQPSAPSATPVAAPKTASTELALAADDPERVVCKTEALVGSHLSSRICGTNRVWDERRQADREAFESFVLRSYSLQPR